MNKAMIPRIQIKCLCYKTVWSPTHRCVWSNRACINGESSEFLIFIDDHSNCVTTFPFPNNLKETLAIWTLGGWLNVRLVYSSERCWAIKVMITSAPRWKAISLVTKPAAYSWVFFTTNRGSRAYESDITGFGKISAPAKTHCQTCVDRSPFKCQIRKKQND